MVKKVSLIIEDSHHDPLLDTFPISVYVFAFPKLEHRKGSKIMVSMPVYKLKIILRGLKRQSIILEH